MRGSLAGLLLLYGALCLPATGYVMQEISFCSFEDKENVSLFYVITFNHLPVVRYSSEDNMFLPYPSYTPEMHAVVTKYTTEFNKQKSMTEYVKSEEKRCKEEIKTFWNATVERSVKPSVEVFFPDQFDGDSLPVLICHVWGFYPPEIVVAWVKNDKTVVKNETQAVRSGDWTYQVVVKLDMRDSLPEDHYSCVVDHASLNEAMVKTWKAGLTSTHIIMISASAVIFALGLISLLIGVICWRSAKRSGYTPIPGYDETN